MRRGGRHRFRAGLLRDYVGSPVALRTGRACLTSRLPRPPLRALTSIGSLFVRVLSRDSAEVKDRRRNVHVPSMYHRTSRKLIALD